MKNIKRETRTTMTWKFINEAGLQNHHMPTTACGSPNMVQVVAAMFRGKATLRVWFQEVVHEHGHPDITRQMFCGAFSRIRQELRLSWDIHEQDEDETAAVHVNGHAVWVDLKFSLENGCGFTHAAMQKFVELVRHFGTEEYLKRYELPAPSIVQETMVEAYAEDNWIPYGEFVWGEFYPPIARRHGLPIC